MPVDVERELRRYAATLNRNSEPITAAEATAQHGRSSGVPVMAVVGPVVSDRRRSGWTIALSCAAACLITVAGLAILTTRANNDSPDSGAAAQVPMAPPGALVADPVPAGWSLEFVASDPLQPLGDANPSSAVPAGNAATVYATDSNQGGPYRMVLIQTFDADLMMPNIIGDVSEVRLGAITGQLHDSPYGRAVSFERDGLWFSIASQNYDDAPLEQIAAATSQSSDQRPVVAADALPPELVDRRIGAVTDPWWIDRIAVGQVAPLSNWTNGDQSLWYQSVADPGGLDPLVASGSSRVDSTVWGGPATIVTHDLDPDLANGRPFRTIVWVADGRTNMLGGRNDLTAEQLSAFANALRPASADEWQNILDRVGPQTNPSPATPVEGQPNETTPDN